MERLPLEKTLVEKIKNTVITDEYINNNPNEASLKNNNPAGITRGMSKKTKDLLEKNNIKYSIGTARPKDEGGNYVKFNTLEEGMMAYLIMLKESGSPYIYNRLCAWVGTNNAHNYSTEIIRNAGIHKKQWSELDNNELTALVLVHLKRESPALYKLIKI